MPPFAFTGGRFAEGIVFATIGFSSHGITLLEHVHLLERFVQYNVIVYGVEDWKGIAHDKAEPVCVCS